MLETTRHVYAAALHAHGSGHEGAQKPVCLDVENELDRKEDVQGEVDTRKHTVSVRAGSCEGTAEVVPARLVHGSA